MSTSYSIPASSIETEYGIKKSRFITRAHYAANRQYAMAFLDQAKQDYPDARHHCWAYQIGNPRSPATAAMSDDGEPSGTAGKPILNVIQHKDIGDLMIIVVRYFGGIKLGAGGLVRAYSAAAQQAIDQLETKEFRRLVPVKVEGNYALEQSLRHWLDQHRGHVNDISYSDCITATIAIEEELIDSLAAFIATHKGRISRH